MKQWPETQSGLLMRLPDGADRDAWLQFAATYCPAIYQFAKRRGLQHTDADELVQRVSLRVYRAATRWSQGKTPTAFRRWLSRVARNALINLVSRESKYRATGGSSVWDVAEQRTASSDELDAWSFEVQRQQMLLAAETVRHQFSPENWHAFQRVVFAGESVEEVARDLGKSAGAIYATRARIVRRIREAVSSLDQLSLDVGELASQVGYACDSSTSTFHQGSSADSHLGSVADVMADRDGGQS